MDCSCLSSFLWLPNQSLKVKELVEDKNAAGRKVDAYNWDILIEDNDDRASRP